MADQEIKTSIDGLITYLNEHGETNTTVVATALGVGEATIIEWSNILEKANMIRIVHKSGRMFLSPLRLTGATTAEIKIAEDSDQLHVQADVASQIAVVNQISAKIDQFTRTVSAIDDLFKTKYKNVKPVLDKLNEIQNRIDEFEKKTSTKSKQIQDLSERMEKEFDSLQKYSVGLSGFSVDTNNARSVSDDINARIKAYDANSKAMSKEFDAIINKYRKSAAELHREAREKNDQLRQIVELEERQIREYEATAKDYRRDSEAIIRKLEQRKKAVLDDISKTKLEVGRLGTVGDKDLMELKSAVDELKKGLGDISGINDGIVAVRKDLEQATAQKNALLKELGMMMQDVKNVGLIKKPAEKQAKAVSLKEKAVGMADKVSTLKQSAEKIKKDFDAMGGEENPEEVK